MPPAARAGSGSAGAPSAAAPRRPRAPACCSMIAASESSSSTDATVGRDSPASCPSCVRLIPGRRVSASITRRRLSSRGLQRSLISSISQGLDKTRHSGNRRARYFAVSNRRPAAVLPLRPSSEAVERLAPGGGPGFDPAGSAGGLPLARPRRLARALALEQAAVGRAHQLVERLAVDRVGGAGGRGADVPEPSSCTATRRIAAVSRSATDPACSVDTSPSSATNSSPPTRASTSSPRRRAHRDRGPAEHDVARRMAEVVVDLLEAVEVEVDQRDLLLVAPRPRQLGVRARLKPRRLSAPVSRSTRASLRTCAA